MKQKFLFALVTCLLLIVGMATGQDIEKVSFTIDTVETTSPDSVQLNNILTDFRRDFMDKPHDVYASFAHTGTLGVTCTIKGSYWEDGSDSFPIDTLTLGTSNGVELFTYDQDNFTNGGAIWLAADCVENTGSGTKIIDVRALFYRRKYD